MASSKGIVGVEPDRSGRCPVQGKLRSCPYSRCDLVSVPRLYEGRVAVVGRTVSEEHAPGALLWFGSLRVVAVVGSGAGQGGRIYKCGLHARRVHGILPGGTGWGEHQVALKISA